MRLPRSLRGRIALAAVGAVALCGALAGGLLLGAVERDGRNQLDSELRERVDQTLSRPVDGYGRRGGGDALLRGTGSFAQIAYGSEVTAQAGDVPDPDGAPVMGDAGLGAVTATEQVGDVHRLESESPVGAPSRHMGAGVRQSNPVVVLQHHRAAQDEVPSHPVEPAPPVGVGVRALPDPHQNPTAHHPPEPVVAQSELERSAPE